MSDFDGGPAFPVQFFKDGDDNEFYPKEGMTKRELYALGALVGAYFSPAGPLDNRADENAGVARRCFELADAMLAESEKGYE